MKQIPDGDVRNFTTSGGKRFASAISARCPHCGERVTFSGGNPARDEARSASSISARCPACNQVVHFWTLDSKDGLKVYMHPDGVAAFELPELGENLPEPLRRAFVSTVEAFNEKNYVATTVCGRRTLEGIFKYLLPPANRGETLAAMIDRATKETDLAAPLKALSHAIRDGGNLGAHFDAEREPDLAVARQMVQLLAYLITYLYVLPRQIKELEERLGKDDSQASPHGDDGLA